MEKCGSEVGQERNEDGGLKRKEEKGRGRAGRQEMKGGAEKRDEQRGKCGREGREEGEEEGG